MERRVGRSRGGEVGTRGVGNGIGVVGGNATNGSSFGDGNRNVINRKTSESHAHQQVITRNTTGNSFPFDNSNNNNKNKKKKTMEQLPPQQTTNEDTVVARSAQRNEKEESSERITEKDVKKKNVEEHDDSTQPFSTDKSSEQYPNSRTNPSEITKQQKEIESSKKTKYLSKEASSLPPLSSPSKKVDKNDKKKSESDINGLDHHSKSPTPRPRRTSKQSEIISKEDMVDKNTKRKPSTRRASSSFVEVSTNSGTRRVSALSTNSSHRRDSEMQSREAITCDSDFFQDEDLIEKSVRNAELAFEQAAAETRTNTDLKPRRRSSLSFRFSKLWGGR